MSICCCCLVTRLYPTFATPWTVVCQDPSSMGFPRQEHWSGLPFPPPGDLPKPRNKSSSPVPAGGFFTTEPPEKTLYVNYISVKTEEKKKFGT